MLVLALALPAAALAREMPASNGSQDPLSSLVLVLNVISATHARPATGVVLARASGTGPALVLVPAGFVAAGDEIVVLDGGTDIHRHGRRSRTVARSAEAGVALLEVESLARPGVELSADAWPPPVAAAFEFAAWPPAERLAEGAPLIRRSVRLKSAAGEPAVVAEPAPPDVSGPLFDRCGRLAALRLSAPEPRLLDADKLSRFLSSGGFEVTQSPCYESPAAAPPESTPGPGESVEETASMDTSDPGEVRAVAPARPVAPNGRSTRVPGWTLIAALLALTGALVYLRWRARPGGGRMSLEEERSGDRTVKHELDFERASGVARFECDGREVEFQARGGRVHASDPGGEDSLCVTLAVGGTPCVPGEEFVVADGEEIRLADRKYALRIEPGGAESAGAQS